MENHGIGVSGAPWSVSGRLWGVLGRLWSTSRASWGVLDRLGSRLGRLGALLGRPGGPFWPPLAPYGHHFGTILDALESHFASPGEGSRNVPEILRCWVAFGPHFGTKIH